MLVFRQLFDPQSSTYTYLARRPRLARGAAGRSGVRAGAARRGADRGARAASLKWTLETHVHADHVTGAWLLRAEARQQDRDFRGERRRGSGPLPQGSRPGRFRETASGGARHARPHRRLHDLRARRRVDGVHRRRAAHPRLRPHRLPAGRSGHAFPLGARTDLLAARATACSFPGTITAASPPPASARRSSTIRASPRASSSRISSAT